MDNEIMEVNAIGNFYCSMQGDSQEERLQIYKAFNNSKPLEDMIDKTIQIQHVIIQPVQVNDMATGQPKDANRIVLIDPKGNAYGCTSSGVETSIRNLFGIVGPAPWNPPLKVKPVKSKGRKGYNFTSLEIVD